MDINLMTDEELVKEIAGRCITDMAAVDLAHFIRACVQDSNQELVELVDGAKPIIESWTTESPAQTKWKKVWLIKARQALARYEGKES